METLYDSLLGKEVVVKDITPVINEEGYPPARTRAEFDRMMNEEAQRLGKKMMDDIDRLVYDFGVPQTK